MQLKALYEYNFHKSVMLSRSTCLRNLPHAIYYVLDLFMQKLINSMNCAPHVINIVFAMKSY